MKGIDYYESLRTIYKVMFVDNNILDVSIKFFESLNNMRSNGNLYDQASEKLKIYLQAHQNIDDYINSIDDKYYLAIINSFNIKKYVGNGITIYIQDLINRMGLTNSSGSIIERLNYSNNEISKLEVVLESSINSIKSINEAQYADFKNKHNDNLVLQVKVNKSFIKMAEFKEHMDRMDRIITSFKRACEDEAPEENIIYSVDDGCFIVNFAAFFGTVLTILKCVEMCYKVRIANEQLSQEIARTKLFKGLKPELIEQIVKEKEVKLDTEKIIEDILLENSNKSSNENKNEIRTLLEKAINYICEFINKDGDINLLEESKNELLSGNCEIENKEKFLESIKQIDQYHQDSLLINKSEDVPLLDNKNENV